MIRSRVMVGVWCSLMLLGCDRSADVKQDLEPKAPAMEKEVAKMEAKVGGNVVSKEVLAKKIDTSLKGVKSRSIAVDGLAAEGAMVEVFDLGGVLQRAVVEMKGETYDEKYVVYYGKEGAFYARRDLQNDPMKLMSDSERNALMKDAKEEYDAMVEATSKEVWLFEIQGGKVTKLRVMGVDGKQMEQNEEEAKVQQAKVIDFATLSAKLAKAPEASDCSWACTGDEVCGPLVCKKDGADD